jgi:RNA polymerase sigma-70 factor (ECF subfamily)
MEFTPFNKSDFELLFKTHFKGLTVFAIRYVKDVDVAKELVQDAFVSLWEKRDNIDTSKSVKSYLTTIIYNKCLNHLRDHHKFNRNLLIAEQLLEHPDEQKPDDELASNELEVKINAVLNSLPDKCQEVFILSRYENLKYQEISKKLDISTKTVEAQISKALKIFREQLKDYIGILLLFFLMK